MSDRTNRDIGRKKEHKKHWNVCGCWLCTSAKEKIRVLKERVERREFIRG
jgi:3'-phosphoadenosine 5'-phosphosulfate sulfotransferase (PAPS reductase)/FAD synthetase